MAYDEALADRVRELVSARAEIAEIKMFGGLGFTVAGNMAVGVMNDDLIVRLDPADAERAIGEEGVREFDFTGRPMKGWIFVSADRTEENAGLAEWVEAGAAYAASLPPK
jgi:TfoX/Sxy family transcriptional regulator of competence genes